MKITVVSDLHFEVDPDFVLKNPGSDLLILAGDIIPIDYLRRSQASPAYEIAENFRHFLLHINREWDHVVYVPGNHEYYHGRIPHDFKFLKNELAFYQNIHVLDNQAIEIGGVKILGSTLWTDLNKGCPITENTVGRAMNDYRYINAGKPSEYKKFRPIDGRYIHVESKAWIQQNLNHEKVLVITHHSPSHKSIHERYRNDYYINGAYHSALEDIMLDNPQIKLWVHGHCHNSFQYKIGETTICCNPKGYWNENREFDPKLILEI